MKKTWYNIVPAKNGAPVSITIEGEIGGWDGVTAAQFRSEFARIGKEETVNLHLVSGGGSIFEGNEIFNILSGHKGEVNITLGSICASIATVIMCAGTKVMAHKNTVVMIHRASSWASGDAEDMRKSADVMEMLEEGIVAAYAAKTGKSVDELKQKLHAETWMNAEDAKAFGFVDEILDTDASDDVVNEADMRRFKNRVAFIEKADTTGSGLVAGLKKIDTSSRFSLHDVRNALISEPKAKNQPPKIMELTAEQKAEQEKEIEKKARAKAFELFTARIERDKEIRTIVATVLKRDKKDFSELAEEYILDDKKTVADFTNALVKSEKFKDVSKVVGSGIEMSEPMDDLKGSAGFHFVNSEEFRSLGDRIARNGVHQQISLQLTVPVTGFGFRNATQTSSSPNQLTSIEYVPGISPLGVRQLRIKDLIMPGATNATTIRYRREDAFANAAAAINGETGSIPNVAVSVAEVDAPVKDIGGYIELSENLMADYLAVASFINMRLPYMVERATEDNLLNGDGNSGALTGLLSTSGIQTQAVGADTNVDAIHKAITKCRFVPNAVQANAQGGYEPDAIVMNPLDWEIIRLAKDANGQYLAGGPFTGAYGNGQYTNVYVLWGKLVIVTPAIASGTALVGAYRECSQFFQRQGIVIEMTNSNGTNFINRIVTLRAAERLALTVPQPNGFCQVTGIA